MYFQNVYCGHEYTTANLKFGLHVEPENEDIITSLKQAQELRTKSPPEPTVPSNIGKDQVIHFKSVIGGKENYTKYNFHHQLNFNVFSFISVGKEKLINPFMRVGQKTVRDHSGNTSTNVETMKFIRTEKDNFKPT